MARLDAHAQLHHLISDALIAESDSVTNTEGQPSSVQDVRETLKGRLLFGEFRYLEQDLFDECVVAKIYHRYCEHK